MGGRCTGSVGRGKVDELRVIPEMYIRARTKGAARSRSSVRSRGWLPAGQVRRHPHPLGYPNEGIISEKKSTVYQAQVASSIFRLLTLDRGGRQRRRCQVVVDGGARWEKRPRQRIISLLYVIIHHVR